MSGDGLTLKVDNNKEYAHEFPGNHVHYLKIMK